MTLLASEEISGGFIRDLDGRLVTTIATDGGKTLQFVPISTAASGATQLVAAAGANVKIKVVSYVIVASAAVTVKFQSAGVDLTGAMALAANGGVSIPGGTTHLFETAANAALNINLGGAVQVSGHLAYFTE